MHECPACGEKVKIGAAVCKHCGAILDEDKAAKHGLDAGAAAARAARLNTSGTDATEKKFRS
jgi:transcription initiation factor TFIIIB Brf1 subunit/transcription initiation factor TFIIB